MLKGIETLVPYDSSIQHSNETYGIQSYNAHSDEARTAQM